MTLTLIGLIAQGYLNTPYVYGANGWIVENGVHYQAFDCSGFVQAVLRDADIIKDKKDRSAQMLYNFLMKRDDIALMGGISKDAILFFGKSTRKISHVAIAINDIYMIDASSGDSSTRTIEDAKDQDAKVKLRQINFRRNLVASIILERR